ncbi:MAG: hypothetical protein ACP5NQ_07400 [Vulcanisaeta sp.]
MSNTDINEVVRVSTAVARKILSKETRKALGLYYIMWSTYPIVIALMFTLSYEFKNIDALLSSRPFNVPVPLYIVLIIATVIIYGIFTGRIFSKLFRVSRLSEIIRYRRWRRRISIILMYIYFAITIVLTFLMMYSLSTMIYYIPLLLFVIGVLYTNYNLFRSGIVKVRYYDHLANASFAIIMIIGPVYYFTFYMLSLIWVYAGVRSLLEVVEGEQH